MKLATWKKVELDGFKDEIRNKQPVANSTRGYCQEMA
jgi:hypothetical protein